MLRVVPEKSGGRVFVLVSSPSLGIEVLNTLPDLRSITPACRGLPGFPILLSLDTRLALLGNSVHHVILSSAAWFLSFFRILKEVASCRWRNRGQPKSADLGCPRVTAGRFGCRPL
jgi:hypothetical protein